MNREIKGGQAAGSLCEEAFDRVVVDHGHRVAAGTLGAAIDTGREDGAELRRPGRFRDRRLTGEGDGEAIFPADKLGPFLGERRPRYSQYQCR